MRTTTENATFRRCFLLKGLEKAQPPGTYEIEIEEEPIEGLSFIAYRRVATFIRIPMANRGASSTETFRIDWNDLQAAQERDRAVDPAAS
jgi:hypothetical protein